MLTHVPGFIPWYTLMIIFDIYIFFFHVFFLCFTAFSWHSPSWWHRESTGTCMWSMSVITLKWTNVNTFASSALLKIMKFARSFKTCSLISRPTLQLWWVQRTSEIHAATDKFLGKLFCVLLMSYFLANWAPEERHSWVVETERFNRKYSACEESVISELFVSGPLLLLSIFFIFL